MNFSRNIQHWLNREIDTRLLDSVIAHGKRWRTAISGLSMIVFVLTLKASLDWNLAIHIFAILLIHELGHIFAAFLCRIKQSPPYFLPMLGAFVLLEFKHASVLQRVFILAMGPIPGLIIGYFLYANSRPYDRLTAELFLFINLLNLLPIYPLDGGRIIDAIAFSKPGWKRSVYQTLGVCGIAIAAIFLKEWVAAVLFGLALLIDLAIYMIDIAFPDEKRVEPAIQTRQESCRLTPP